MTLRNVTFGGLFILDVDQAPWGCGKCLYFSLIELC